jgi:hypothetical protein
MKSGGYELWDGREVAIICVSLLLSLLLTISVKGSTCVKIKYHKIGMIPPTILREIVERLYL